MDKINITQNNKIRYNIVAIIVYIVGIVLLVQLFNLQIVNGEEYRQRSNTRLTRETTLKAARGNVTDSTGNKLVSSKLGYSIEIYKSKADTQTLNNTILEMIKTLETNGDSYIDNLPITVEPFAFTLEGDSLAKWKTNYNIKQEYTAEQAFNALKEKYGIQNENIIEARKIMLVRYEIARNGYSNTKAVTISKNISETSAAQFSEQSARFPGINVVKEPIVSYPSGTLASHILGYVGRITAEELEGKEDIYSPNDIIGKSGVQYVFEDYLKGKDGIKQIDMSVDGTVTDEHIAEEAVAGNDVVLTIDANLQKVAEEALKNNIEKIRNGGFSDQSDANAGAVVVMKVQTGEVLAMASYPDYEPGLYAEGISNEKQAEYNDTTKLPMMNRAISQLSAPGSTFKMISAVAGLQEGAITPIEKINDTGVYPRAYHPVCWYYSSYHSGHGWLNVSQAIKHSCNYFFYEIGYRIGIKNLAKYANYFGLGEKTGIELRGEVKGTAAGAEGDNWYLGDAIQTAIGQSSNDFTPIQMAKYTSMLANGGKQIDVTLVKTIRQADGTEISKDEINQYVKEKMGITEDTVEPIEINQENLNAVLEGMRGVTSESGGTAYSTFKNFNIEVGGKTGSAQTSKEDITNAWFVGFAPYDTPEIAVVVLVENGGHGGYTAEVARDIMAQYFGMNASQVNENMQANSMIQSIR